MAESTEGIVLRRIDYSETSLVVHFFTPDIGQVGALAKGAKRPKSRFQGGVDVLTRNAIVFARRGPASLATLMESAILDDYVSLRADLERLTRAQYCVELVTLLTTEEDPNPPLYDLLVRTLERLSSGSGHLVAHTIRFEIGILAAVGYGIDWEQCILCGGDLGGKGAVYLSAVAGGVVCSGCAGATREKAVLAHGQAGGSSVRGQLPRKAASPAPVRQPLRGALAPGALAAARLLATGARRAERLHLADNQTGPLGRALGRYITYVVGRPPKMLKYIGAISERKRPAAGTADGS